MATGIFDEEAGRVLVDSVGLVHAGADGDLIGYHVTWSIGVDDHDDVRQEILHEAILQAESVEGAVELAAKLIPYVSKRCAAWAERAMESGVIDQDLVQVYAEPWATRLKAMTEGLMIRGAQMKAELSNGAPA